MYQNKKSKKQMILFLICETCFKRIRCDYIDYYLQGKIAHVDKRYLQYSVKQ